MAIYYSVPWFVPCQYLKNHSTSANTEWSHSFSQLPSFTSAPNLFNQSHTGGYLAFSKPLDITDNTEMDVQIHFVMYKYFCRNIS